MVDACSDSDKKRRDIERGHAVSPVWFCESSLEGKNRGFEEGLLGGVCEDIARCSIEPIEIEVPLLWVSELGWK